MSLTREQYNHIMRIINDRHMSAVSAAEEKQEEIYGRIPALRRLNADITKLHVSRASAMLKGDKAAEETAEADIERLLSEKSRLMSENGITPDMVLPKYFCQRCSDTGYVGNVKCGCMIKLETELINADSGLPDPDSSCDLMKYDFSVFDDVQPIRELSGRVRLTQRMYMREIIFPKAVSFTEDFDIKKGESIFMTGPAGSGKTYLTNCIARNLIEKQHSVVYACAGEMFDRLYKESFTHDCPDEVRLDNERLLTAELLIIDDLGTEFPSAFSNARLFNIISHRLVNKLSTIISSNLSLNQISSAYGERVASRLMGDYILMPFYGRDLRIASM